jgi:hypothetical protein
MAKSSPEKLAQALRANLKRRKQTKAAKAPAPPPESAPKPPKNSA